ncbi:MAG: RNA-binding transcriptional accessory protein [Clostridia bacterium]|jgi:uncharacterized protein|nr:RNA-binding transcriptional accessory protein [Clostridia bacterium]
MDKIVGKIVSDLGIRENQVIATIKLIDEGNTIPFISRYRKEMTGGLNDEILRDLYDKLVYYRNLEEKKEDVIRLIDEQGKLTDELKKSIEEATTITEVDDIYRPYRPKKRTRATIAKEKGLEPLAEVIIKQDGTDIEKEAEKYIDEEKEVLTVEDAIKGASDIIAETISDNADYRKIIRKETFFNGFVVSNKAKGEDEKQVYEMYYEYKEMIKKVPGHRILAMNRGEKEKILSIKIDVEVENIYRKLEYKIMKKESKLIKDIIEDSYKRLIAPAIERELRNDLTEKAEEGAMKVFKGNLEQLLMQAPIKDKVVLGLDPAYRTGCKIAVVDGTGKVLDNTVVYPTPPQNKVEEANKVIKGLIEKYNVDVVSIGNGTASREAEEFTANLIKNMDRVVYYVIVNEAGASVYSASKLATEEFPNFDVGTRSAASIARRLQDPLAELVKIDPKAIGIGQYQHDMNQKRLSETLGGVVEDSVNSVGVDINTASSSLLEYVSGISKVIAKNIIEYRKENGKFTSRKELLKVAKLGPKAFEQSAGFLRIPEAKEILDSTAVHPESYKAAKMLLDITGNTAEDIKAKKVDLSKVNNKSEIAEQIGVGIMTLEDIISEIEKPGRDKREDMPKPILKSDVLSMDDLYVGLVLDGTVRNIVDFGAFIDIGVHQDGLVHISQMSDTFIKNPMDIVSVGDIVKVKIIEFDKDRGRISFSMKGVN